MRAPPISYKDTFAMPGSELHKYLTEGNSKKAEQCYQETEERYRKSMGIVKRQTPPTKERT